jgi:alpha-ribazole phosphatase
MNWPFPLQRRRDRGEDHPKQGTSTMKLLLVRHGLTDWNIAQRFQGHTDVPLNEAGRRQAEALANRLAGASIDAIYASDLKRAGETARIIAARHSCAVTTDPRLRELGFGRWEGATYDEIQQRDPAALTRWETNVQDVSPPGGETLNQLAQRVRSILADLRRMHAEETTLLVAHGGSLQVLLCLALGLPIGMYWQFHIASASLSEVICTPSGGTLDLLNDSCHLEGAGP